MKIKCIFYSHYHRDLTSEDQDLVVEDIVDDAFEETHNIIKNTI